MRPRRTRQAQTIEARLLISRGGEDLFTQLVDLVDQLGVGQLVEVHGAMWNRGEQRMARHRIEWIVVYG